MGRNPSSGIAEAIGGCLGGPVVSLPPDVAAEHFGLFAGMDLPASAERTRERLGWRPLGPGLSEDLHTTNYGSPEPG